MNNDETVDEIRNDCWNQAIHAFGTAYIFGKRSNKLGTRLQVLTFLGIVVPGAVGSIAVSFGLDFKYLSISISIAGVLIVIQFIMSIWSLASKWGDSFAYALESVSSNHRLARRYAELAKNPPADFSELRYRYGLIKTEDDARTDFDYKQSIKDKEMRQGMRAALREFQRQCIGCSEVPTSMESSDCPVCGQF